MHRQANTLWRGLAALIGVLALIVLAVALIGGDRVPAQWPTLTVIACAIGLGLAFIGLKAYALRSCCKSAGVELSPGLAARLICEGVAVECLTWPGKLWADGYRVKMLGDDPMGQRVRAMLTYRGVAIVATLLAIAGAGALMGGMSWLDGAILCVIAGLVGVLAWRRVGGAQLRSSLRGFQVPSAVALSIGATLADASAAALIAWALAGVDPFVFAGCYLVCGVLASASGLPLGFGVLDAAGWVVLTGLFGVHADTALAVVLVHRLCGPVVTLCLGAISLIARGMPAVNTQLPQPKRPALPAYPRPRHAAGFSMIELVMVVLIIGVISAIAVPRLSGTSDKAYLSKAKELDQNLERAIIMYLNDWGYMPRDFYNFVGVGDDASDSNYINLAAYRSLLKNPGIDMMTDSQTLRLEFKSGLIVVYTIDSNGVLSSTYTEPSS